MGNITLDQLAGMIKEQFDEVGKKFEGVDKKFEGVDKKFEGVDKKFEGINQKFEEVNRRLGKIESNMLTKDYLDERLADLRGGLVVLTRKEDNKVKRLIEILRKRDVISDGEVKEIMSMEPFAQLFV